MARTIAINNVRVFNGHSISTPRNVFISGGLIVENGPNAEEHIDGGGMTLLPGFIDAHTHPDTSEQLLEMARHGITTTMIMAVAKPEEAVKLRNQPGLPSVLLGTVPAAAPGSNHAKLFTDDKLLVKGVHDVERWMDQQLQHSPDFVKLIASTPGLDQETINALVNEAHAHNKRVIIHAADYHSASQASLAGADQIHHVPLDKPADATLVHAVLSKQISCPTLFMMKAVATRFAADGCLDYSHARASTKAFYDAGIPILAGTDANMHQGVPANVPFGISMAQELELLIEAGLSAQDALRAATNGPAEAFGLNDRGRVEVGHRADVVLIEGNPLEDIKAVKRVRKVWIGGVEVSL